MSLSYLRDNILKALQELVDARTNDAINMRPRYADPSMAAMTTGEYAMQQINTLAEARALALAARIVADEYKKITQPEKTGEKEKTEAQPKSEIYYG